MSLSFPITLSILAKNVTDPIDGIF
jgi:hypothetical protein